MKHPFEHDAPKVKVATRTDAVGPNLVILLGLVIVLLVISGRVFSGL